MKEKFNSVYEGIMNKWHDWKSQHHLRIEHLVDYSKHLVVAASIFVFLFAFFFAFFFQFHLFHTDAVSARYTLSALVQSQAAIVAIIITLTLIAVQLTASAYSPRVVDIFRKNLDMWILLGLYGTSIFYGLIVLRLVEGNKGELVSQSVIWSLGPISISLEHCIHLALLLGIIAFIALAPYIWNIINLLKPENIIKQLTNEITKDKFLNSKKDPIQPIVDIIRGSIRKYDFETTRVGLSAVTDQVISVIDSNCGEDVTNSFCTRLQGVGKLAASITDEESTIEVIENLERFGKDAAGNKLGSAAKEAVKSLEAIGIAAVRKGTELEDAVTKAAMSLEIAGTTAVENDLGDLTMESAKSLGAVGIAAAEKELKGATKQVAESLGAIGTEATQQGIELEKALKEIEHIEKNENEREVAIKQAVESLRAKEAVKQVVKSLGDVGKIAAGKGLNDATEQVANSLGDVGKIAAENSSDYVTIGIANSLGDVGKIAAGKGLNDATEQVANSLGDVGKIAAENSPDYVTIGIANSLGDVGKIAARERLNNATWAVAESLGDVGKIAARKRLNTATWAVAESLGDVGKIAARGRLNKETWKVVESLGDVGKIAAEILGSATTDTVKAILVVAIASVENELDNVVQQAVSILATLTIISNEIVRNMISKCESELRKSVHENTFLKIKELLQEALKNQNKHIL